MLNLPLPAASFCSEICFQFTPWHHCTPDHSVDVTSISQWYSKVWYSEQAKPNLWGAETEQAGETELSIVFSSFRIILLCKEGEKTNRWLWKRIRERGQWSAFRKLNCINTASRSRFILLLTVKKKKKRKKKRERGEKKMKRLCFWPTYQEECGS